MTLAAGSRLGPYEIVSPVGAGGMGEVYRARDTRLERTVAVKVLPAHLSKSEEVRQRFEREAKTISQLSHPHICALYDVGNHDGTEYLVMEFLEGESLADRLLKGPLPPDQVLRCGIEIADALDKAHRQGVVHRDLKPGNVMLTKSGVKLVDFGLARFVPPVSGLSGMSVLPTQAGTNLTEKGTILGTFQYMAPEQLEGKEADARTDIFALGTVLYEMATGQKAFSGPSQATLIAAIIGSQPPPISTIQPMIPPALDRVVRTCLAKDPEDRWQTAHDVMLELKWVAEGGSQAGVPAPVVARRKSREAIAWAGFAACAALAAVFAAGYFRRAPKPARAVRSSVLLPEKRFLNFITISPDGGQLAFVAGMPGGKRQIWVRPLDGLSAQPLAGTENADFLFWSPDARSIAFFADGKLKKIEVSGGPAVALCDAAPNGLGGTWSREGVILFAHPSAPISRIPETGGTPVPVTRLDAARHETTHRYPWFLPDGRHFLYMAANLSGAPDDAANLIRVGTIDSKEDKALIPAYSNTIYAPSSAGASEGNLLFSRDGSLFAQRFDPKKLQTSGQMLPIAQHVAPFTLFWRNAIFSAAENGTMVYGSSTTTPSSLLWFDRNGRPLGTVGEPVFVTSGLTAGTGRLRISPDGRRLAATIFDPSTRTSDVWLYDLTRGVRTRFTSGPSNNADPVWSPDGSRIVFDSDRKHQGDLYRKPTGGGSEEPLVEEEGQRIADDWSPDGRFLALELREPRGERRVSLSILSLADGKLTTFFRRGVNNGDARFSPDGRWIAYTSEESGRNEIYLAAFPGQGERWQVSTEGGVQPRWRRDGKELFYLSSDLRLMSVEVRASSATPEPGVPKLLFEPHPLPTFYDAAADGQRFLVVSSGVEQSPPITLVQNWSAGIQK
jgi:Tol biopolymer transport system component/predicted Ser/Thr protein kinase